MKRSNRIENPRIPIAIPTPMPAVAPLDKPTGAGVVYPAPLFPRLPAPVGVGIDEVGRDGDDVMECDEES